MNRRNFFVVLSLVFLASRTTVLHATQYAITLIPTGSISPAGASINNSGTIAFMGSQPDGTKGIYTYSGGAVHTVTDSTGPLTTFSGFAAINNNGVVAFAGAPSFAGPLGLYTASVGSLLTTIAVNSDTIAFHAGIALNDAGTVAFQGSANGKAAIMSGNGGSITIDATTGTAEGYNGFDDAVSINSSGVIAFSATTNSDSVIATHAPMQIGTTVIAHTGSQSSRYYFPSINNAGTVAFAGHYSSTGTFPKIYTRAVGGQVTPFAASVPGGLGVGPELMNNNGEIVFLGSNYPKTGQVFDGPSTADVVFDLSDLPQVVYSLGLGDDALNDSGQVVLSYQLNDGTQGIALATPVQTPEPRSLALLGAGALALFRHRKARTK